MTPTASEADLWTALSGVLDPELPAVNVVEMGIVRAVEVTGNGVSGEQARITITPTFSGCPALHVIRAEVEAAARSLGFAQVEVLTVLSPAWSTDLITPEARAKLQAYGIAPPAPGTPDLLQLDPAPVRCPRCGSLDTRLTASFGPTLCKSMYVCNACREPFEGFKSV